MHSSSSHPENSKRRLWNRRLWNRRQWLHAAGLTTIAWGAQSPLGSSLAAASGRRAKSCILIWLDGGPSHLETFDPKPESPQEVRGPLSTIGSKLPGVRLSECLPQVAARMNRFAVLRSVTSPLGEHNIGAHYLLTGYKPTPALEYPTHGCVTAHLRGEEYRGTLPPHIAVPNFAVGGSKLSGSGFLPNRTRPFSIGSDPASRDYQVNDLEFYPGLHLERLERRKQIVESFDKFARAGDANRPSPNADLQQAYDLVASDRAKRAFDIREESPATRSRYGGKSIGGCCLLARRLVEQGAPFVTINNRGWDTHNDLQTRLKDGFTGARTPVGLVPSLDQALGALTDDLEERGMLEETLIVVMGEFGRTPKLNTAGGRDHWPRVFSVALAGGGVRGGQVLGASDAVGERPAERPITPADLSATIYTLLGIAPDTELRTSDGRPVRVTPPESNVITELI